MGGLFGSSSDSSAASGGAQTYDSPESYSVAVTAGDDQNSNLTFNMTDHGATIEALNFAAANNDAMLAGLTETIDRVSEVEDIRAKMFGWALDSANQSREDALEFGAGAFQSAIDANMEMGRESQQTARYSVGAAKDAFDQALYENRRTSEAALWSLEDGMDSAIDGMGMVFEDSLDTVSTFAGQSLGALVGAYGGANESIQLNTAAAIAATSEATRSEASQSFDKLVKYAGSAAVAVVVLVIFTKK
jgi:hypothetical protein